VVGQRHWAFVLLADWGEVADGVISRGGDSSAELGGCPFEVTEAS
jgi:hypothetical protein